MHVYWVILVNNEKKILLAIVFNGQPQSYVKIIKFTKTVNQRKNDWDKIIIMNGENIKLP